MSEADKLFEEIGYKTEFEDKISFTFANREKGRYITFIKDSKTLMLPCELTMQELKAINLKCKELGWIIEDTFYQDNRKGIKRFQKITLYEDGISDILKLLNIFEKLQKEIEHQKEKRENQKVELAILNEKQKEMNKLKNTVSSYYGMFKKQEKQIKELQKEKEEILNKMKNKYKIALFMVIRNSQTMPKGVELGKSEKEINKMAYETMCEVLTMLDFKRAEEIYRQGKKAYEED